MFYLTGMILSKAQTLQLMLSKKDTMNRVEFFLYQAKSSLNW